MFGFGLLSAKTVSLVLLRFNLKKVKRAWHVFFGRGCVCEQLSRSRSSKTLSLLFFSENTKIPTALRYDFVLFKETTFKTDGRVLLCFKLTLLDFFVSMHRYSVLWRRNSTRERRA
jgi:hypothetical protein